MQVKVYCEKCKKYEELTVEHSASEASSKESALGIPAPEFSMGSGLKTCSIVHSDHTIIVDIDIHGSIRSRQIIDRIDASFENAISRLAGKILNAIEEHHFSGSLIVVSASELMRKLVISLCHQILLNLPKNQTSGLYHSASAIFFEVADFILFLHMNPEKKIDERVLSKEKKMMAIHITPENHQTIMNQYKPLIEKKDLIPIVILFDRSLISNPDWKKLLVSLMDINPSINFLDVSDLNRAINSFTSIISLMQ